MKLSEFARRVVAAVRSIPPGRVATYGDVARLAGRPRAARAVGHIMRSCDAPDVPCHRVIAAQGRLGGYGGREALKRALLAAEGVPFAGSRVKLAACRISAGRAPIRTRPRSSGANQLRGRASADRG